MDRLSIIGDQMHLIWIATCNNMDSDRVN